MAMIDLLGEPLAVALVAALGGILLGMAARLGRFCTLGAIEDALYGQSYDRARMWVVALGTAITLTAGAGALGWADLGASAYLSQSWSPWAVVLGGLTFGYGMAMAGNCGFGALARLGGGDLRSFVIVLVMGLSALAVLSGPFAQLRVALIPPEAAAAPQGFAHGLGASLGLSPGAVGLAAGLIVLALGLADRTFLANRKAIFWGAMVGLAISGGWVGSTWVAQTGFAPVPVASHTFAAPLGAAMIWTMTASGTTLSFGVGSVAGVLIGAFVASLFLGHFRWEACEDPRELRRQIIGAAMMGVGAVLALGCSVGQGLSAFSVLAYSAPLAAVSIVTGAALGLRHLIQGFALSR